MRTMLKSRGVDMVTCWASHLVASMRRIAESEMENTAMSAKVHEYRQQIHDLFDRHDADHTGMIEVDEQYEFAQDVAKLMVPEAGPDRTECLNKIWDTMLKIDKDGDKKISWAEFWEFVTTAPADDSKVVTKPKDHLETFSAYVLVVVQRADGSFCLVHNEGGWWCIGGEVPMGQSPEQAAIHHTQAQAGLDVRLEGILRVEFDHRGSWPGSRLRTIYLARALNDFDPLKTIPDDKSLAACWVDGSSVTLDNPRIPLAGSEAAVWFEYVLKLGPVYPLEVFTSEGRAPKDHLLTAKGHAPFADSHRIVEHGGEFSTTLGPIYPNSP